MANDGIYHIYTSWSQVIQNCVNKHYIMDQVMPHSENTAFPNGQQIEKKEDHVRAYNMIISKRPQTHKKNEKPWGTALGLSVAQYFPNRCINTVLQCTNLIFSPLKVLIEQTSASCLVELTPAHLSTRQCCIQKRTNI